MCCCPCLARLLLPVSGIWVFCRYLARVVAGVMQLCYCWCLTHGLLLVSCTCGVVGDMHLCFSCVFDLTRLFGLVCALNEVCAGECSLHVVGGIVETSVAGMTCVAVA